MRGRGLLGGARHGSAKEVGVLRKDVFCRLVKCDIIDEWMGGIYDVIDVLVCSLFVS